MRYKLDFTLYELLKLLDEAIKNNEDQQMINMYAYEITCRLYVPHSGISFDEMLEEYGYKEMEKIRKRGKK